MKIFSYFIILIIAIPLCLSLVEPRFDRLKTIFYLSLGILSIFLLEIVVDHFFGEAIFRVIYPLHTHIPTFLLINFLSKQRGSKALFSILTACFVYFMSGNIVKRVFDIIGITLPDVNIYTCIIVSLLAFFIISLYRPLHLYMLNSLEKGWLIFSLIPIMFLVLYDYVAFTFFVPNDEIIPGSTFGLLLCLLVSIIYAVLITCFRLLESGHIARLERDILHSQLTTLANQTDSINRNIEELKIYRHDIRHHVATILSLLDNNDIDSVKDYILKQGDFITPFPITSYCTNVNINAILSFYLGKAKEAGIEIKTQLDIPSELPFEDTELSMVLANSIDNAYQACISLPDNIKPYIELHCISSPHFVLKITNPTATQVCFDKNGMPVSSHANHGIGTKSIKAFVQKNNGELIFSADEHTFTLHIMIQNNEV